MIEQEEERHWKQFWRVTLKNDLGQWISRPFREAVALLSSFSLINLHKLNGHISMHPLVHAWAQDR